MQKHLLHLLFIAGLLVPNLASAQCSACFTMEEALKKPDEVRYLNLRNQGLQAVPAEIGLFMNLETLDLSYNLIIDFPDTIQGNPLLKDLRISHNYGLNVVDLMAYCDRFQQLTSLEAAGCGIHFIPENITKLELLQKLDLSRNKLKILPGAMERLEKLENLDLSGNELKEIVYVSSSLWNLKKLDVSNNEKMELSSLFLGLSFLDKLEELTISQEEKEISFPNEIGLLTVPRLVITNTVIKKLNPALIKNKALRELVFDNCTITNETQVVSLLKNMGKLEKLEFNYTPCFQDIADLKQLNELVISQSPSLPLAQIGKMKQLQSLDLRRQDLEETQKEQLKTDLPKTNLLLQLRTLEETMASNTVKPIVELNPIEKTIPADQATTLLYTNTQLNVPKNAFLNQDGSLYQGNVKVEMTELFDPVSMALSGSPMIFGTGKDAQLFGSNGMFEISAKDEEGKDLKPNPAAIIRATIQNVQPEVPGQLFIFNPFNGMNAVTQWNVTGTPVQVNTDSLVQIFADSLSKLDDISLVSYIDIPIIVKVKMKRKRSEPSLVNFTYKAQKVLNSEKKGNTYYRKLYLQNQTQRMATKYEWKIDSTVSTETRDLFRKISIAQSRLDKKKMRSKFYYDNYPRHVKDMKIEPNFEKDHFVLSFKYRDSTIKIPVYLNYGGNTKSLIEQQSKFYDRYMEKAKTDEKFYARHQKKRDQKLKEYADSQRNLLIGSYRKTVLRNNLRTSGMSLNADFVMVASEQLKFGLSSFGLVNCDYFFRNPPEAAFALSTELKDQENNPVKTPATARMLIFKTNTYLEVATNNIPYYSEETAMLLFEYEENKLAVINVKKDGNEYASSPVTIDITGLEGNTVKNKILALRKP